MSIKEQPESKPMTLIYTCGCKWEFIEIPHEHWRHLYCDMHEAIVIKEHDRWVDEELKNLD